jgi:hypothetical protein
LICLSFLLLLVLWNFCNKLIQIILFLLNRYLNVRIFIILMIYVFINFFNVVVTNELILVCSLTHCQWIPFSCSKSIPMKISFRVTDSNISIIRILCCIEIFLLSNCLFIIFNSWIDLIQIFKWIIVSLVHN